MKPGLTYADVVDAPVAKLKAAADDWSEMVTKLEELADDARAGMKTKADKADWDGVNVTVTKPFRSKTAKELEDAAAEARSSGVGSSGSGTRKQGTGILISAAGKVTPRRDLNAALESAENDTSGEARRLLKNFAVFTQRELKCM
ncbi:hypothetical protein [Streptomyces sp. NPDC053728]|uniref:hypothetical protein n=1 Tax=Streptomyces sp. NPDC053728 TaxID=3155534 RepID=UPI00344782DC